MLEGSLVFPRDEYQGRVTRLQAEMASHDLSALFLTMPADIFYVTGFLTRFWESPARPWFVIVPALGKPVAVIPSIGADLMGRTWIDDIRTWQAPNPVDDGVSLLKGTLVELVPKTGKIGVPMGLETHLRMPFADFNVVAERIAPRVFVDATSVVQRVREIKSEAEIEKIRLSCAIAGDAFSRVPEFAGEGAPLDGVFRNFQAALLRAGADWVSYVAGGAGPYGYKDVISPAEPTPLIKGDVMMLDTGAVKDGYFCDFDRNFVVGTSSAEVRAVHETLWMATETAFEALQPGIRAADVHRLMADAIKKAGFQPATGRLGHGLGVTLTEWPSFTPHDEAELRAGMVLTLEPVAMTKDGCLLVHEENIVLREKGAEWLSPRAPFALQELS